MARTKTLAAGVQVLLGLVYLAAGLPKLIGAETSIKQFEKYGFPHYFCRIPSVFETLGGVGLFTVSFVPWHHRGESGARSDDNRRRIRPSSLS